MAVLRLLTIGWLMHLKSLTRSSFFLFISIALPIVYASIAFFMVKAGGGRESLRYVALGAGFMGIWQATLFGSGEAIQFQRSLGTLEPIVAAPAPLLLVMAPLTVATASIGLYSVLATLACEWAFFATPPAFAEPVLFAIALPTAILSLGMLGLLLASTFTLYRHADALSSVLDYPVWLASGLLVPLSLLPGWVTWISWALAPRWGIEAVRNAALGGRVGFPLAMCAALGVLYLIVGAALLRWLERLARERATLPLT